MSRRCRALVRNGSARPTPRRRRVRRDPDRGVEYRRGVFGHAAGHARIGRSAALRNASSAREAQRRSPRIDDDPIGAVGRDRITGGCQAPRRFVDSGRRKDQAPIRAAGRPRRSRRARPPPRCSCRDGGDSRLRRGTAPRESSTRFCRSRAPRDRKPTRRPARRRAGGCDR